MDNQFDTNLQIKRSSAGQEKIQSKINQETQQSSQRCIVTEASFDLICKERDALIQRLELEQKQLKKQLEERKLELCDLQKTLAKNNQLLKLQQPSTQLQQVKPDVYD